MDHPLAYSDAIVRPWRTATLVAVAVAAVELVLLIVVGGALLARDTVAGTGGKAAAAQKRAETPAARVAPSTPAAKAELARTRTRVLVLNGNGRQGAAASTAGRVQQRGYRIGGVANAPRMDYTRTLVMYRSGFEGEGRRLAADLGVPIVGPLDGLRPAQLAGAHLVVVVGS